MNPPPMPSTGPTLHSVYCVLMRGGTSKGPFFHRKDLPVDQADWAAHLVSALGSLGSDDRQVDGVGGGTSTTSKVAVVSPSAREGVDVDFTFVQVAVGRESVDLTGNCGNMISGVGPFAIQEKLVSVPQGATRADVRIYNTNTDRTVLETIAINEDGTCCERGECIIAGVPTPGSEIKVAFEHPAGSMTGKLFPSGKRQQVLTVEPPASLSHFGTFQARVTLIDAANPFIMVDEPYLSPLLQRCATSTDQDDLMEAVRRVGAVVMGLSTSLEEASKTRGTPKIALISPPITDMGKKTSDIRVQAYSMGLPHPTLSLTGAVCVSAGVGCTGTVLNELAMQTVDPAGESLPPTPERTPTPRKLSTDSPNFKVVNGSMSSVRELEIQHSRGNMTATIRMKYGDDGDEVIESVALPRTARRLFEGRVRYYV